MDSRLEIIASEYRAGKIDRRIFLERLGVVIGSYPLVHHFLETSGRAESVLSPHEEPHPRAGPRAEEARKRLGKSFDPKIYPGAAHAFFNDTSQAYNEAAAKDAWARSL